jgi:hypothetical protein
MEDIVVIGLADMNREREMLLEFSDVMFPAHGLGRRIHKMLHNIIGLGIARLWLMPQFG